MCAPLPARTAGQVACRHRITTRTRILTHEDAATQNLFEMVSRYHENVPKDIRLEASTANAKELSFASVDGGYRVGTARTTGVTRLDVYVDDRPRQSIDARDGRAEFAIDKRGPRERTIEIRGYHRNKLVARYKTTPPSRHPE